MVTFAVDEVAPVVGMLPTRQVGALFPDALAVGGDPVLPVVVPDGVHPLLSAVGRAFAEHRPLVLSPDAVWLTIAQGVAQHVRLHADTLRPRLVGHVGRQRLEVVWDGPLPQDAGSWHKLVESFSGRLAGQISGPELFECDFSTSTDVERVAGRIMLLDAYSPYFALWLRCVCGIPTITLTGTVQDWQQIRARVDGLARFGLDAWCRSLAPITEQFVRAAAGEVDTAFWRRIYNPADAYGGEVITGWAARLYPYLQLGGAMDTPNPLLDLPIDQPRELTFGRMGYNGPGVRSDAVPATLARVIVNVNDRVQGENQVLALHAGLVGVHQQDDGGLRPVAGWHVAPGKPEIDDVLDRIVREHDTTAPQPGSMFAASPELVAPYRRIGSARLFDGAWRLRPVADHGRVARGTAGLPITAIIDLADGRCVGAAVDFRTETLHWVVCHIEQVAAESGVIQVERLRLLDHPADVPVYGTSLTLLLEAALDTGGDIAHLETGRLDHLDAEERARTIVVRQPLDDVRAAIREHNRAPLPQPMPDTDLDTQIMQVRAAKEQAIDEQDFERAAQLRDREKALLTEHTRLHRQSN
jgi:hypothetical protein